MKKHIMYVTPKMEMMEIKAEEIVITSNIDGDTASLGTNEDFNSTAGYGTGEW